jgi:pimeloyl-ACP methyl ester carboxylesterase
MQGIRFKLATILFLFSFLNSNAQTLDTLVDVGGYKLHFHIVKGKGTPILFDAGGGDDASAWDDFLPGVSKTTGATLITYDRAGFGKSTFDTTRHGLLNGIKGLEAGLHKLGYDKEIVLVAHSQGAFYATVYANRHPDRVKTAVLIDGSTSCWFEPRLINIQRQNDIDKIKFKSSKPGTYYQLADLSDNVNFLSNSPFPVSIPVIDFVSGNPPFDKAEDTEDWRRCHREFVQASNNRTAITAYDCGHYIFLDNPALVVNGIIKAYSETLNAEAKNKVLNNAISYNLTAINETKRLEGANLHSESDLNSWGYLLLKQGKMIEALSVFRLNTLLFPNSWNAFDSYGETLLKDGQKQEAIKMYERSVELNPGSENGKKVLKALKQ